MMSKPRGKTTKLYTTTVNEATKEMTVMEAGLSYEVDVREIELEVLREQGWTDEEINSFFSDDGELERNDG